LPPVMLDEVFCHAFFSFQQADVTMLDGSVVKSQRRLDAKTDTSLATLRSIALSCRYGRKLALAIVDGLTSRDLCNVYSARWRNSNWHRRMHKSFDMAIAYKKPDFAETDTPQEKLEKAIAHNTVRYLLAHTQFHD
jgi:hypothetical protein